MIRARARRVARETELFTRPHAETCGEDAELVRLCSAVALQKRIELSLSLFWSFAALPKPQTADESKSEPGGTEVNLKKGWGAD